MAALIFITKVDDTVSFTVSPAVSLLACRRGVKISGKSRCMGYREVVDTTEDGKVYGKFTWMSYNQIAEMRDNLGSGMKHLELNPVNSMDMRLVGIFSKNRYEWVVTEQACNAYQSVVVPLYDTLGPNAVAYILHQCELATIFCGKDQVADVLNVKRDQAEQAATLKTIVQFEDVTADERKEAVSHGITLRSFGEVMEAGKEHPHEPEPPSPEDVATFCYTSGTTGDPKGAMLTHGNIVADLCGAVKAGVILAKDDTHLSYLPLAHMFERIVQAAVWMHGGAVGFYQGDTLKLMEDLACLQPSIFPSVPRLYNKIYDKVMGGVKAAGGLKASMFQSGFEAKQYWLKRGHLKYGFWDSLVFDKVKARMGLTNCRLMLTGSAPIAAHVMEFLRIVFSCPVMEGYGQTECAAACTVTSLQDQASSGHVGSPLACNELKLVNVEDMGYLVTDTKHGEGDNAIPCIGRGEVCYRGPNIFRGYYRMEEKTREALDEDGWLHSGDIGIWTEKGQLKIVDRKKNIFKLSQGEYVAAEKIENVYAASLLVAQVFVYGDSFQSVLVGIVVPEEEQLAKVAGDLGITGTHAELCANEQVNAAVLKEMKAVGTAAKLRGFEHVKKIHLEPELWSVDNEVLTPTFKLKRNVAKTKYKTQIDAMYASFAVAGKTGLAQGESEGTGGAGGAATSS